MFLLTGNWSSLKGGTQHLCIGEGGWAGCFPSASPDHAVHRRLGQSPHQVQFPGVMQICANKTQIQLVAGSQEHPEGKKKETLGDSGMDVASGVTSIGALARRLSGVTPMKASWETVQTFLAAAGGAQLKCTDSD